MYRDGQIPNYTVISRSPSKYANLDSYLFVPMEVKTGGVFVLKKMACMTMCRRLKVSRGLTCISVPIREDLGNSETELQALFWVQWDRRLDPLPVSTLLTRVWSVLPGFRSEAPGFWRHQWNRSHEDCHVSIMLPCYLLSYISESFGSNDGDVIVRKVAWKSLSAWIQFIEENSITCR